MKDVLNSTKLTNNKILGCDFEAGKKLHQKLVLTEYWQLNEVSNQLAFANSVTNESRLKQQP